MDDPPRGERVRMDPGEQLQCHWSRFHTEKAWFCFVGSSVERDKEHPFSMERSELWPLVFIGNYVQYAPTDTKCMRVFWFLMHN